MRTHAIAVAALVAALPLTSRADDDQDRPRSSPPSSWRDEREAPPPRRPERAYRREERGPPRDAYGRELRPPPGRPPAPAYPPPYRRDAWWGSGWGWGYAPLYPRLVLRPGYGPAYAGDPGYGPGGYERSSERDRLSAVLRFTGAGSDRGAAGGVSIAMEGPVVGLRLGAEALAPQRIDGAPALDRTGALGYVTAHVTWALLSDQAFKLELELGGSMLTIPSSGSYAGMPYAGTAVFGPSVGVSGHLGLVGPVGFEAHARVTPYPVPIADTGLDLVLRGGPFAVTAGWRSLDLSGDGVKGPSAHFSGPELGLAVAF